MQNHSTPHLKKPIDHKMPHPWEEDQYLKIWEGIVQK